MRFGTLWHPIACSALNLMSCKADLRTGDSQVCVSASLEGSNCNVIQ
jgi:hypothetical protein